MNGGWNADVSGTLTSFELRGGDEAEGDQDQADGRVHVAGAVAGAADVLVAWEAFPHRDVFETGVRGASAVMDMLGGRLVPTMALAKRPVLVGGGPGRSEGYGPCAGGLGRATRAAQRRGA